MLVQTSQSYKEHVISMMPNSDHYSVANRFGEWKGMAYNIIDAKKVVDAEVVKWSKTK